MNIYLLLGVIIFVAAFGGVLALNSNATSKGEPLWAFTPPYHFTPGEPLSQVNAFLFVLVVSAAFFGLALPLALGVEGAKYASLFTTHAIPTFDLLFAVPQLLAAYAISLIGQGAVEDYAGQGTVFAYWRQALKWFLLGVLILAVLIIIRPYLVAAA